MKIWKILLPVLLIVAIICVLAACAQPTATVTFYNGSEVYETVQVKADADISLFALWADVHTKEVILK